MTERRRSQVWGKEFLQSIIPHPAFKNMNYIRHLTGFYEKIHEDSRLNPTHISLYLALFQFWNLNHFQNPISISRNEMMKLSKIAAYGTYHKCIKDLQDFGYIEYLPSFNPYKGSMVNLFNFEDTEIKNLNSYHAKNQTSSAQALNQHHIKIDTGIRQALEPSINYINNINNKHSITTPETSSNFKQAFLPAIPFQEIVPKSLSQKSEEKEKLREKKKKSAKLSPTHIEKNNQIGGKKNFPVIMNEAKRSEESHYIKPAPKIPPTFAEVKLFFEEKDTPLSEAERFFDHYESNGWLVGGKSKMKNWEAAARNWLKNSKKFNDNLKPRCLSGAEGKRNNLQATTNKSYKEPL